MLLPETAAIDLAPILDHFRAHGWARVGRALSDEGCALLRDRTDDLMLGRVVYPGLFFQLDSDTGSYDDLQYGRGFEGPSLDYRKLEKLELDPDFRTWINNRFFEKIARGVVGDGAIAIYRAVLFNKGPRGGSPLPWHQDGGRFWGVDRAPTLQIWTALDDAPEAGGCLEVLSGTHSRGLVTPEGGVVPKNFLVGDEESRAIPLPARAGEVILVHNHVWHRSLQSRAGRRRALSVCYMSGATRCLRQKRAPREFVQVFR
jgi:hypothetical protein